MSGSTIFRFMALMALLAIAYARSPTTTPTPNEKPHVHSCSDNGKEKLVIPDTNCRDAKRGDLCIVDNDRGYCDRVGNCDNDQCQLRCTPIKQRVEKVYDLSNY